jgi:undecaprenyl diphosphate synthase
MSATISKDTNSIPSHIGFILDGNRRWARANNLPTLEGHRRGYHILKDVSKAAFERGVECVSAYIFSTENWNRSKEEVDYLMKLTMTVVTKDARKLIKENIRIVVLGIEDRVSPKLLKAIRQVEDDSKDNNGGTLALCFNYGGKCEIVDAMQRALAAGIKPELIDEKVIEDNLYHPDVPAVDLVVRTSGEQRLSNFMLWRIAYAELYFVKVHWPDFTVAELDKALEEFSRRNRRFGGN